MPAPTHIAGSDSRPVFSVVSAILRPWPSPPITFSAGHEDVVEPGHAVLQAAQAQERVAPLDRDALRVALDHERGDAAAVARRDFGTCAMTTSSVATVPLVAHSFTPLSR